jgi:hypothetical protein
MDVLPQNVHWLVPEEPVPCDVLHFRGKFALGLAGKQNVSLAFLEKLAKADCSYIYVKKQDLLAWSEWQKNRHPTATEAASENSAEPSKLYGNKRAEYLSYVQKILSARVQGEKSLDHSLTAAFALVKKVISHPMLDWHFQQFHEPPDLFFHTARVAYPLSVFALLHGMGTEKEVENIAFSAVIHELSGNPNDSLKTVVSQQTLTQLESEGKPVPSEVIALIGLHDELFSGKGFPKNRKGDDIPELIRAFALFNHFDHYRLAVSGTRRARFDQAKQKMKSRQADYDPELWHKFWDFLENSVEAIA